jgi:hypothetical protein
MKSSNPLIAFYHKIGGLFYAVAAVDGSIKKSEVEALRALIKKEWLPLEASVDEFGTDAAYQIESAFDWHQENQSSVKTVLENFSTYYRAHKSFFTPHVKLLIVKTAERVAYSFAGKNASEQQVLITITDLFLE